MPMAFRPRVVVFPVVVFVVLEVIVVVFPVVFVLEVVVLVVVDGAWDVRRGRLDTTSQGANDVEAAV